MSHVRQEGAAKWIADWITRLMDWPITGLDQWTELLDWTDGLNYWTGLICSYHITSSQSVHNIPRARVAVTSNKKHSIDKVTMNMFAFRLFGSHHAGQNSLKLSHKIHY